MPYLDFSGEAVLDQKAVQSYRGKEIVYRCHMADDRGFVLEVFVNGEPNELGREVPSIEEAMKAAEEIASDVAFGEIDDLLGDGLEAFDAVEEDPVDTAPLEEIISSGD